MKKKPRSYGNGSIYKTSDHRWVVKVSLGSGPDGKPLTKRFSAKTKAEAEQKLRAFKNEQQRQNAPSPVHYTVRDYFDYRLKTYPISNQYRKTTLLLSYTGSTPRGSGICSVRSKSEIIQ